MFEEFWNGILELIAKFVLPDWGAVIGMLPVLILVLALVIIIVTAWRLWRAPDARRGKGRITPRTPADIHMPGPSMAPIFASIGAFLLFLGLVFGGTLLVLGVVALALTLLYWLVEALRVYDRDLGPTATTLPAVVHEGPPPGVHMPGPSFRPFLGALGSGLLMLGLVFGEWLLAAGIIALVVTLAGWLTDARKEYVKVEEADATGHLENIPAPRAPRRLLVGITLLVVAAFVIQAGWIPPRAPAEAGGPTGSGAPPGSPPPGGGGSGGPPPASGPAADATIHAKNVDFVEDGFTGPADTPFTLAFVNDDPSIQHNVEIKDDAGTSLFKGEIFAGVDTRIYDVPALAAGAYPFICTVHPNMTGTATIQ
jgi:plastocyanin